MKKIIVAIDGPAASGKSTTAKLLAKKLGYVYLDTGAMYRACALQALREGIELSNTTAIINMMSNLDLSIAFTDSDNAVYLSGKDVSMEIRTPQISSLASAISSIPEVRYKMVALQRKLSENKGVVLDGRDIGTVVFPEAEAKFFMVATLSERAIRRHLELKAKGLEVPLDIVLKELEQRDSADASRAMAPLKPADDSIEIDTSCLSIEEQVSVLYDFVMDILKETNCLSEQYCHPEQSCHSGLEPESNKLDSCLRRNDK
ncbi:MAG: (d)CMP kinase, partial [Candidatus Cloacimonetes bacterium]|nr:(d)CMP kinase [Candidatus Cloacimonadota bacterium]